VVDCFAGFVLYLIASVGVNFLPVAEIDLK
jgi:hypothetical protein